MAEQRQIFRWQVMREGKLQLDTGERILHCLILDINLKGMQISVPEKLPESADLKMNLQISSLDLDMDVAVQWKKQEGDQHIYGLSFQRIADRDKTRIFEYVSQQFPQQLRKQLFG